jgi:hypothetical protein
MATNVKLSNATHDLIRQSYIATENLPDETTLSITEHLGGLGVYRVCVFRWGENSALQVQYPTALNHALIWAHDKLKAHGEV